MLDIWGKFMELSYVNIIKRDNKIFGEYHFAATDDSRRLYNSDDIFEYVNSHEEKQLQIFLEYDLISKSGYYDYPLNDEKTRIVLIDLHELCIVKNLEKLIKYNKEIKDFDFFFSIFKEVTFTIDGKQFDSIDIQDQNIIIGEHFIINSINNIKYYRYPNFDKTILELLLLNSDKLDKKDLSKSTNYFLYNIINNLIDKKQTKEKYTFIISQMRTMITEKKSEKEWQSFIYDNYRYIFPEYLTIVREFTIETIDSEKKHIDFLLTSQNTDLLLEIKLPQTQVISSAKDRNNYYFVAGVNKAILQAFRYYISYKDYLFSSGKEKHTKVMLLIGLNIEATDNTNKANNDFELARSLYSKIEIITYSELINKLENIKSIL